MTQHREDNLTKRCDCGLRKQLVCSHGWHMDFFRGGKRFRYSLDVIARARGEQPPRSKDDAEAMRDRLRAEIRDGVFKDPHTTPEPLAAPEGRLTLNDLLDRYNKGHVEIPTRRESAQKQMRWHVGMLRRVEIPAARGTLIALGAKFLDEITKADVEQVRHARRAEMARLAAVLAERKQAGRDSSGESRKSPPEKTQPTLTEQTTRPTERYPGEKGGEVGINRLLARLRHAFAWAIAEGITERTPFKKGGVAVIALTREQPRQRRFVEDEHGHEEDRLLQRADKRMRDLLMTDIATGCRPGELANLQFRDVEYATDAKGERVPRAFLLWANKTKTGKFRRVPIGSNVAAIVTMRRYAPDGKLLGPTAYVFGNEAGEKIKSARTAWKNLCRRAGIDGLQLRDVRREFGSRVLESGSSLIEARDLLGHANISQTSTYLQSTAKTLGLAIERKEAAEQVARVAREQRQQGQVSEAQPEQSGNCHTGAECDNAEQADLTTANRAEVVN